MSNMKIGEALLRNRLLAPDALEKALKEQGKTKEKLGDIITRLGLVDQEQFLLFLAKYFDVPFINLREDRKSVV